MVKILGTERFVWNGDNIYISDPDNPENQIRMGLYDGVNYGIGYTNDGGSTWQNAIGFYGGHLGAADRGLLEDAIQRIDDVYGDIDDAVETAMQGY